MKGVQYHYKKVMTFEEINAYPVQEYCADDCILFMWAINNFLPESLAAMKSWGFRFETMLTWDKQRTGLGQYFAYQTEQLLFGIKGHPGYKVKRVCSTLISAPREAHSKKPDVFYEIIERASRGPYLELFARRRRKGWTSIGNEL